MLIKNIYQGSHKKKDRCGKKGVFLSEPIKLKGIVDYS